jgi:hypothetical protein
MIDKIKSKLLMYLFNDWLKSETDVETLQLTKKLITITESKLTGEELSDGRTIIVGFRNSNIQ